MFTWFLYIFFCIFINVLVTQYCIIIGEYIVKHEKTCRNYRSTYVSWCIDSRQVKSWCVHHHFLLIIYICKGLKERNHSKIIIGQNLFHNFFFFMYIIFKLSKYPIPLFITFQIIRIDHMELNIFLRHLLSLKALIFILLSHISNAALQEKIENINLDFTNILITTQIQIVKA